MIEVSDEKLGFWDHVGNIGGAMVTAAAGFAMTRFEARASLPWEKNLEWPVKIAGYALMGYAVYDALRDWLGKGNGNG